MTIYVSAGIARRDDGVIVSVDGVRCEDADAAIDHAERLSQSPGYIGGWAFTAEGNPTYGFEISRVLGRFGSFPDYRV
jgi:chloramphenicol 3-O-phosphotransferase